MLRTCAFVCLLLVCLSAVAENPAAVYKPETTGAASVVFKTPAEPAIHGPRVVGATPGRPFIFLVPATGEPPLAFAATNLPAGLSMDAKTGIISGAIAQAATTTATIEVTNAKGSAKRALDIRAGEHCLALTPPMGWNSWNIWAREVTGQKMRDAADGMVKSGLAAHGYQYINLDDCWEGTRDGNGKITTNERFPDMKGLADYIHAKGLRFGIYTSPGPKTCADYEGTLGHEEQDARTYAEWGADYLKYDWCSYKMASMNVEEMKKPFRIMHAALDKCGRDIVFSLSQGGTGNVWEWGPEVGANVWRTTGDINDKWDTMAGIGFGQNGHEKFAGPGHWNDPDMLVAGSVKWGAHLKPDEQITHVTLWSLLAAPLLIGCDLSKLDEFTTALLSNDEMIDVNQDPLGQQASCHARIGSASILGGLLGRPEKADSVYGQVWARELFDGTLAVGLFNLGAAEGTITAAWDVLGLKGAKPVRDLWRHRDLGEYDGSFSASVPSHGCVFLKIGKPSVAG